MDLQETSHALPHPETASAPRLSSSLDAPATRREILLFGLLILAVVWLMLGQKPRTTLIVVPDLETRTGVIT